MLAELTHFRQFFKTVSNIKQNFYISGEDQAEVQLMSKINAETKILVSYTEDLKAWLHQSVEDVMEQRVVKTDMTLRHIFNKGVEVKKLFSKISSSNFSCFVN